MQGAFEPAGVGEFIDIRLLRWSQALRVTLLFTLVKYRGLHRA